jgi:TetR/AcrR family transcriptional repressor of nem operon
MAMGQSATRQKLIDTALELMWQSSYGTVGVDDICKAINVRKGSFYYFFPSKADLALAAMDHASKVTQAVYDEAFSASRDPVARFERYAEMTIEGQEWANAKYGHVCGCPLATLGSEMAGQGSGIPEKFGEIYGQKLKHFEAALRDMIMEGLLPEQTNVKVKAQELLSFIMGQLMMARIQNDLVPLKRDLKAGLVQLLGVNKKVPQAA